MENNILNYVKQKTLKNYFDTDRDFVKLFPEEDFNFNSSSYTHFLYFDKEEAFEYVLDFLHFIKEYYNMEVFSYQNYFHILDEFKKYMEANNVLLYLKTKMGLSLANYNNDLLLLGLKKLFGEQLFCGDENNIAFSNKLIPKKRVYKYAFFNYLTEKLDGYNNYIYTTEPLLADQQNKIINFFKGFTYSDKTPFYLNQNSPYFKDLKKILIEKLTSNPLKVFTISKKQEVCGIIIANTEKTTCNLTIICDNDNYDSEISYPLLHICNYLFTQHNIEKIITINENKGIAYSGINSALTMARFKPDYSLNSDYNGYSKIKYELRPSYIEDIEIPFDNSIINFIN